MIFKYGWIKSFSLFLPQRLRKQFLNNKFIFVSDVDEDGEVPDVAEFEGEAEDEEKGHKVRQTNINISVLKTFNSIHKLEITL